MSPSISQKGQLMPASPIRKLVPFAQAAKARGLKIFHLNIGQPDIETPSTALEALHNFTPKIIEYSDSTGIESFKQKTVAYYKSVGIDTNTQEIIITTGGSEALMFGFLSCFDPGDEVIIPEPYYANYNGFAIAAGIRVVTVTSSIETGFALPNMAEIEAKISPRTKGILICNPGNPTGTLYTQQELSQLSILIKKHNLYLFADEVYREFCYDGHQHQSIMQFTEIHHNIVLMDSLSKRFSMCGSRIGVFLSKNKEVIAAATKFAQSRLSPPTLGQIMGEAALDEPKSYIENIIQEYQERRNLVIQKLNAMPGVVSPCPKGAFYTIAQLPIDDSDKFCQWLLQDFQYKNQTVMLAPATGFYENPELGKQQVRIAYVLNKHELEQAMECLQIGLQEYQKQILKSL